MQRYSRLLQATRFLKDREVFVQPRRHGLRCEELFLLVPGEYSAHWAGEIDGYIPDGPSDIPRPTRIYCRRSASASRGRVVENVQEVEDLFRAAGFAIVDSASMTIAEQKTVFQSAEIIAGIGGAAFANARFRHDKPLTIGILMASSAMSTEIPAFAKAFGFRFFGQVFPSTGPLRAASVQIPRDTVCSLIDHIT
jgi:capsular polysaccharide biosynthesis protein